MRLKRFITESIDEVIDTLRRDCQPFLKEISPRNILLYRGSDSRKFVSDISQPHTPRKDRKPVDMEKWMFDITNYAFKKVFGWKARSEGVFVVGMHKIAQRYGNPYLFFPIGKYEYIWSGKVDDLFVIRMIFEDMRDLTYTYFMAKKARKEGKTRIYQIDFDNFFDMYDKAVEEFIEGNEMKMYRIKIQSNTSIIDKSIGEDTNYITKDFDKKVEKKMEKLTVEFVKKNYINSTLRTYKNYPRHEIMFNCNKYYLVQPEFTGDIMRELL